MSDTKHFLKERLAYVAEGIEGIDYAIERRSPELAINTPDALMLIGMRTVFKDVLNEIELAEKILDTVD